MKVLSGHVNRLIGQAMHTYDMLADGDKVMVAVSGGVDSLVLVWLLEHWRHKAPINYELLAVHLDMGFEEGTLDEVDIRLQGLPVESYMEYTDFGKQALITKDGKSGCFHCAKQRRNRLFSLAQEKGYNKIAFGHHKEDIIETFFLNLLYSGNLSTLVPRQDLFGGKLAIIRPLALLMKKEIVHIAKILNLSPVENPCPLATESKRQEVRDLITDLTAKNENFSSNIFAALSNPKTDYLLTAIKNKGASK